MFFKKTFKTQEFSYLMLIDVHCHLDYPDFEKDLDEVIKRAKKDDMKVIISNGTNPESNRKVKAISEKYDIVKPAYGFYPTEIEEASDKEIEKEIEWIRKNKPVAIGEVGLEGKNGKDFERQEKYFRKFVELAKELDIPIIVHSRKKERDALLILNELEAKKVIMHTFMGKKKLAFRAADKGYFFSIPTMIVYSQQLKEMVKGLDMKSILTETDAPFLAPKRGKRNEPRNVQFSIKEIAEIKGLNEDEVKKIIFMNYQKLFAI